jgi:diaminopimelate decarboxylase
MKIYISGLYSGTNPQPGIGIARSLRAAFPNAKLVGVEYSNRCSGIHWQDFDEIDLHRPWDELDLDSHAEEVREILDSGAFWISSIDLEILWFANVFPDGHPNLLTPPLDALKKGAKPGVGLTKFLPVAIPPFVWTDLSDWELHAFCRKHNWRIWLKGPYYEAARTPSWPDLEAARAAMTATWATEQLYLQAHVSGYEESVSFCAYKGELIDCVYMKKRDLTELSKTWAGSVDPVSPEMTAAVRKMVADTNWTGGGELEMVRDPDDKLWLLECNPRFPAWIHGSTIAGMNIPARLVEAAAGMTAPLNVSTGGEFTRVVIEVPLRGGFPLPPLPEPLSERIGHSLKHPSGLPQFADRLKELDLSLDVDDTEQDWSGKRPEMPHTYLEDLNRMDLSMLQTPVSVFLEETARSTFATARDTAEQLSTDRLKVSNAYSIKTDPDEKLLKIALESGFYAEAISLLEAQKALDAGFDSKQVILNGPAKWWRRETFSDLDLRAIICDSAEELASVSRDIREGSIKTEFLGVRLRPPGMYSRFGVPIETPDEFSDLVTALQDIPDGCRFAIHFHMASSNIGIGNWRHLFQSMLQWCTSIERLTGHKIELLDMGGGWFPADMIGGGDGNDLQLAARLAAEALPNLVEIVNEPGKAMAQPASALAMQILEIRDRANGHQDVVVDGSIAELPMHAFYPHRILHRSAETRDWTVLSRGKTQLLGRLCMEHDIVARGVSLPENSTAGDLLVFCDAGAYDRSMSYVFGCG